jgi:hypothetical protein
MFDSECVQPLDALVYSRWSVPSMMFPVMDRKRERRGASFTLLSLAAQPANRRLTIFERVTALPAVVVSARRAGCGETCLSGSTEAHRSNPGRGTPLPLYGSSITSRVIPMFYPMEAREVGRRGHALHMQGRAGQSG